MKYGVDIEAGNAFVERLKEKAPSIGGFNGMFPLPSGYEKPVLVSGADGVGTKLNICRVAIIFLFKGRTRSCSQQLTNCFTIIFPHLCSMFFIIMQ